MKSIENALQRRRGIERQAALWGLLVHTRHMRAGLGVWFCGALTGQREGGQVDGGRVAVAGAPCGGLQEDRGLSLIGCDAADAQQGRDGVEQAAHAAGERAVDAALDHLQRDLAHRWIKLAERCRRAGVVQQVGGVKEGQGVSAGVAHRCRRARQAPRRERSRPSVAAKVAEQQLAAPHGAVRARAGTVERQAQDAVAAGVLGHDGGDVGVVVLDFDERGLVLRCLLARPLT